MPARSHRPLLLLLAAACAPAADHDHGAATAPEWPSRALTTWTDRFEYFIEHDLVLPGRPDQVAEIKGLTSLIFIVITFSITSM
ncbi:MAG: hypothetical protein H8E31_08080 [Planctomycetes bacterium]|nr:hypothetical protein [Planctomycetota bacterium]